MLTIWKKCLKKYQPSSDHFPCTITLLYYQNHQDIKNSTLCGDGSNADHHQSQSVQIDAFWPDFVP